ncbi:MAG: cation:H+ antiporter [Flavobacteriales bacterium]|jgi:cation:H+ antiporter
MDILLLLGGLALLVAAGELLVRGAAGLALKANISPMMVGLTVVSIGTSAPELFASVRAALEGNPGLAVGNVIGSNIANISLVLGITALINPIGVSKSLLKFDAPLMVLASLIFIFFAWDLELSFREGAILVGLLFAFIGSLIYRSRKEKKQQDALESDVEDLVEYQSKGYPFLILLIIAGCIGLYFGSEWFISGARNIASNLGVSDYIIGVTVVAFGTSIPELVASSIAALRNQGDLSIGNLVGSNIFNILSVIGITSMVSPLPVDAGIIGFDIWWMLGIALLIFPIMRSKYIVSRWQGALLVIIYLAYIFMVIK